MTQLYPGKYPHVYNVDLHKNGLITEVLVMAKNAAGSIWFIPINTLDGVDRQRILRIIQDPLARSLPLYEVMANRRLGNGAIALEYFHQLVKQLTPSGIIVDADQYVAAGRGVAPAQVPVSVDGGGEVMLSEGRVK
jgi:hypothetical protein